MKQSVLLNGECLDPINDFSLIEDNPDHCCPKYSQIIIIKGKDND